MKKVDIKLLNCYGIKKLEYSFDFSKHPSYLLYASNGTMKTSFTKTFNDLHMGKKPKDEIYGKNSTFEVVVDGTPVVPEDVFVVQSYADEYISPNSAKLMVHRDLRKRYDEAIQSVRSAEASLWAVIEGLFCENIDIRNEIANMLSCSPLDVLSCLKQAIDSGLLQEDDYEVDFLSVNYNSIFCEAVEKFVSDSSNYDKICEYASRYNELLENSPIFKRGIFSHNNADIVFESLNSNGFFGANHSLLLNGVEETICSSEDLSRAIKTEKDKIFSDEKLKKKFEKINGALGKKALVPFRSVIEIHPEMIPELANYSYFKRKVWVGIFKKVSAELKSVISEYEKCQKVVEIIKEKAATERSQWDSVLEIFKSRFTVPFTICVPNKNDVSLLGEMPEFVFKYVDPESGEEAEVTRKKLETVLSQGEKRALFLLNVINDLEALKMTGRDVLVVTDDIAESFDYKNKYAIIEYLQEMMSSSNLHFIVLTHNFDFYRTVATRAKEQVFPKMVQRIPNGLEIVNPKYVYRNPFEVIRKGIRNNVDDDIITSIPFVRNIIEYTSDANTSENYQILTSLLHLKPTTKSITFKQLESIYNEELKDEIEYTFANGREVSKVYYSILNRARDINFTAREDVNLDGKIILSMAIRLLAEEYMLNELVPSYCTQAEIDAISSSQTGALVGLYKKHCPDKHMEIKLLDNVLLMSSENIHINSFMFEPLIDTSIKTLSDCFSQMCSLYPPKYSE